MANAVDVLSDLMGANRRALGVVGDFRGSMALLLNRSGNRRGEVADGGNGGDNGLY